MFLLELGIERAQLGNERSDFWCAFKRGRGIEPGDRQTLPEPDAGSVFSCGETRGDRSLPLAGDIQGPNPLAHLATEERFLFGEAHRHRDDQEGFAGRGLTADEREAGHGE